MAEKRDYYEVLGVSKDSSPEEIKKAYRSLAKKYHPDVSTEPKEVAEAKFKEISEAYEVLSDPDKKARYDQYGMAGMDGAFGKGGFTWEDFSHGDDISDIFGDLFGGMFGGGRRRRSPSGPQRGEDLSVNIPLDLKDVLTGRTVNLKIPHTVECKDCKGTGAKDGKVKTCPGCGGRGQVQQVRNTIFGQSVMVSDCPTCGGRGTTAETVCPACRGRGRLNKDTKVDVKIPAGAATGNRLRVPGAGDAGYRGGQPGDLYVFIQVRDHPDFVRDGSNLITTVDTTYPKLVLGGTEQVKTLDGQTAELNIPPGTQVGEALRLSGLGLPEIRGGRRGDLYVKVNLPIPKRPTAAEKELLQQLDSTATKPKGKGKRSGLFGQK